MAAITDDLAGKRITVMGLGRFGGGLGVTRWLAAQGADVLVTDLESSDRLRDPLRELDELVRAASVALRLGEHNVSDFTTCDLVVANPAVPRPWENRFLRSAQAAGVPITTEIRLLIERLERQRVIGVTGSTGKSTTAAMIHHVLTRAGARSHFGGNIGGTLLNSLDEVSPCDWIVLELSSAMLYWLGDGVGFEDAPGWSPHIAVLTNLNANHIDWHGSFEHYRQCKENIFRWQVAGDIALWGQEIAREKAAPIPLAIPGEHNQRNARVAAEAASCAIGIEANDAAALLRDFAGLPHRLQLVLERDGLRFYNDSKSTTPEATLLAIAAFESPQYVHLIAGGYDKGSDLSPISKLAANLAGLYTVGATGRGMAEAAPPAAHAVYAETLDAAVEHALARMSPGAVLLLSPGCASWDQFTNYEQRGERFTQLVWPSHSSHESPNAKPRPVVAG